MKSHPAIIETLMMALLFFGTLWLIQALGWMRL